MKKTVCIALAFLAATTFLNAQKIDTTKKQKYFYLVGTLADFQTLLKMVDKPEDATRKEIAEVKEWILNGTLEMIEPKKDSTTSKQKPIKN